MERWSWFKNSIGELQTITKISTRIFMITRHTCHRCIYIFDCYHHHHPWNIFVMHGYPFSLKQTLFCCLSLSLGGFRTLAIRWSTDLHLKHLQGGCSVCCLSKSPALRALYDLILSLIFLYVGSVVPSQKVHFPWTRFLYHCLYQNMNCFRYLINHYVEMI